VFMVRLGLATKPDHGFCTAGAALIDTLKPEPFCRGLKKPSRHMSEPMPLHDRGIQLQQGKVPYLEQDQLLDSRRQNHKIVGIQDELSQVREGIQPRW
jgi:hypothetical protein